MLYIRGQHTHIILGRRLLRNPYVAIPVNELNFQSCCQPISRHVRKSFSTNMASNKICLNNTSPLFSLIAQDEWSNGGHVWRCVRVYAPTNCCDIYFNNRNALGEFYVLGRRTVDPILREGVIFQRTRIMLAHWGRGDKMADNLQTTFSTALSCMEILVFDSDFTDICLQESDWHKSSIGSDNGLASVRRQAIIWTNQC